MAAGVAYAADLHGVVLRGSRAALAAGRAQDAAVCAPVRVYGSPIIHRRRFYLAACNLEERPGRGTVVECLGD